MRSSHLTAPGSRITLPPLTAVTITRFGSFPLTETQLHASSGSRRSRRAMYVFVKGWTPDGRRLLPFAPAHRSDLAAVDAVDYRRHRPDHQILRAGGTVHAALSPYGRYIAYAAPVRDDDVTRDSFIIAVDGSQEFPCRRRHPAHDWDSAWSADGTHVLFRSNRTRRSSLSCDTRSRTLGHLAKRFW